MWTTGLVQCRKCGCQYVAIEEGDFDEFTDLGCPHCFQRTCDSAEDMGKTDPLGFGNTRTCCDGNTISIRTCEQDTAVEGE